MSSMGGIGWKMEIEHWFIFTCDHCLAHECESKMQLSYDFIPEIKIRMARFIIDEIVIESNYQENNTNISKIDSSPYRGYNYQNKASLDLDDLLFLEHSVAIDFSSKESVESTIKTLLTFK